MMPMVSPGRRAAGRRRSDWVKVAIRKDYLKRKNHRGRVSLLTLAVLLRGPIPRSVCLRGRAPAPETSPCRHESKPRRQPTNLFPTCLLYTSDAADEEDSVD